MKDQLEKYRVIIRWSEADSAYIAGMPGLPYTAADGQTREEALANLYVVAQEWMETAREKGWTIPKPGTTQQAISEMVQRRN